MKLISYTLSDSPEIARVGFVINDEEFISLNDALSTHSLHIEPKLTDIHSIIEAGPQVWNELVRLEQQLRQNAQDNQRTKINSVNVLPAVQRPSKISCIALNNSANVDRIMSGPSHPALFTKPSTALVGHGNPVLLKKHYGRVHPEPELAVVIGKKATNISAEDAFDYVFGYTIHNDLTAPILRGEDTFHYRAIHPAKEGEGIEYIDSYVSYPGRYKGADTFSPLGPWIVTRDEITDPHSLKIECHVGDECYASDNTMNLFHKLPQVLEFISAYSTLLPGDVVSLGTALGSDGTPGRAVQNADLNQMSEPVSVTIQGIGRLSNPLKHL